MYPIRRIAQQYLRYLIAASNGRGHGMHSPFVYSFVRKVLADRSIHPEYRPVESLRKKLLLDRRVLEVDDHGAGSVATSSSQRTVASIAKTAAKPRKYGQLLFRMARFYRPSTILELGTSLGISTAYLSLGAPGARLITIEGAAAIAAIAEENMRQLSLQNVRLVQGNFDDCLGDTLRELQLVDLAFVDGNHRYEPTMRYFHQILQHTHNDSILIFDDIHWSREMEDAWEAVRDDPRVRCTIDLFFIGIVLFRQEFREPRHFTIRF